MCRLPGARAARARQVSRGRRRVSEPDDQLGDGDVRSGEHRPGRAGRANPGTGYGAELPAFERTAFEEQEALDQSRTEEYRALRAKAIVAIVAGVVAMVLSMPLMTASAHAGGMVDPVMSWAMRTIDPALRSTLPWLYAMPPRGIALGLFVLTAVIMTWAGRHFYTRAWAAFRHHSADMNTLIAVGTGSAFIYSAIATLAPGLFTSGGVPPDVYYEAVIIIIGLILLGNALEARAKGETPRPSAS